MRALRCGEGDPLLWNVEPIGDGGLFSSLFGEDSAIPGGNLV